MKLDEVRAGRVYLDTNVVYMYLRSAEHLSVIRPFMEQVVRGQIEAFVSVPVFDELFYRLLLARIRDNSERSPLDVLRGDPQMAIGSYSREIALAVRRFRQLPNVHLVGVVPGDLDGMLRNITTFSLLPRDALHLAILWRLGIDAVASDDMDFDRVAGLERHWIINPPAPVEAPDRR